MFPPTLKIRVTGTGVKMKGALNNFVSAIFLLSSLFDEVPIFPNGIIRLPTLRVNIFLRIPSFKFT